jgi:hypothetical protein
MKLRQRLFSDLPARERWAAGLAWFRLRYREPAGPTRCLRLLSRPAACGRIALHYRPGVGPQPVATLYLGIPEIHIRLLQRMAADFGLALQPATPDMAAAPARRLAPAAEPPWDRAFTGQLVDERLYIGLMGDERERGRYFPRPPAGQRPAEWQLPAGPPLGLSAMPSLNGQAPPAELAAGPPDARAWPLGLAKSGRLLQAAGRVNLYGRPEAAAGWLVRQITHMIAADPGGLVVIDGSADLVPRLKRQAVVTRLLGKGLAYLDLAGPALSGGFNPLAAVPGENEAARLDRWRRWFEGMGVPSPGLSLLARAMDEGAADIPGLRKWLRRPENRLQQPASAGLVLALNRLAADPDLADWLAWPANGYDILPAGALFFACRSESWAGQQLLRGVLLAALARPETRLVIHGFPWAAGDVELLVDDLQSPAGDRPVLVSNGPLLPDSTILLGQCSQVGAETLADRFLDADPLLVENLQLLGRHEVLVLGDGSAGRRMVFPAAWPPIQTSAGDSGAAAGGPAAASSPAASHDGLLLWAPRHQNRTDDRQNP